MLALENPPLLFDEEQIPVGAEEMASHLPLFNPPLPVSDIEPGRIFA